MFHSSCSAGKFEINFLRVFSYLYTLMKVYLDNAATTPIAREVLDEMLPYLTEHFGNPSSIHAFGRKPKAVVEKARKTVANFLNASTGEIFFTSCGTESNNMVLKNAVHNLGVKRIITSPVEHDCVLNASRSLEREIEVVFLRVDERGYPDLQQLEQLLAGDSKKTLVSLMHANNEIGTMISLDEVAGICSRHGALFHSDMVQTLAYHRVDVQQTKVHFLSGSAHKFHGPKGIGFIYINSDVAGIEPYLHGGGQERNMRGGTENVAGIAALGKALEIAAAEFDATKAHIRALRAHMIGRVIAECPGVLFNGDVDNGFYKILSISVPESPRSEMMLMNLDMAGIAASGGSACSSGSEKGSHVLEAIKADESRKTIRFSFSKYNTQAEVDYAIETLKKLL
jgi:cysteine desulfurase